MNEIYPSDWISYRLGDVIKERVTKTKINNQHEILSVTKDGIVPQKKYFKKQIASENNIGYKVVKKGDLVFSAMNLWMGSLDVLKKIPVGIVSPAYTVFSFIEDKVDSEYMSHFMRSPEMIQIYALNSQQGASVVRRNLDKDALLNEVIYVPPVYEQNKISSILNSVDLVIEGIQKKLIKLKDLKRGTVNEFMSRGIGHNIFKQTIIGRLPENWEIKSFSECFSLKNGINTDKESFGSGTPFITYKNVYSETPLTKKVITDMVQVSEKDINSFSVRRGDLLITRTSESIDEIGLTNTYLDDDIGAVFNGFCIRARPKNNLFLPEFTLYAFRSDLIRSQIRSLSKYTTRAGISGESLDKLILPIPPINEQEKLAKAMDSISNQFDKLINLHVSYQNLKKSLMQDLLTGKVRVRLN